MRHPIAAVAASALLCAWIVATLLVSKALLAPTRIAWLAVEAPRLAERGRAFDLRIRLAEPAAGTYLHADIHGEDEARRWLGYLAGDRPIQVTEGRRDYSFSIRVPERSDLSHVDGLVYLSREGSWSSLIAGARLASVPVAPSAGASPPAEGLSKAALLPLSSTARFVAPRFDSLPLRALAAAAFAACALIGRRRRSRPFALACLAACAWEIAMPEEALAGLLRGIAASGGWYRLRRGPQLATVLAALSAGVGGAAFIALRGIRSRRAPDGLAWLGLYAYACLALLRLISQHDIDSFLSRPAGGIQAGQALRLACAAGCAAALALGQGRPGEAIPSGTGSA